MAQISEELIMKFIDNRCTEEELQLVKSWMDESDDNARMIFQLENIAMHASNLKEDRQGHDRVWNQINRKIDTDRRQQQRLRRLKVFRWGASAAVLTGFIVVAAIFFSRQDVNMVNITADNGCMTVTLPDSSKVWLNSHASISYPETFADNRRQVSISGEAYFEVTHDESRPFIVDGKWINVTVLGTKFNFTSLSDKKNSVSLIEGKVEVRPNDNNDGVVLSPGQKAEFNPQNGQMSVTQSNTSLDAVWHDRLIHFHNATVSEIASDLETLYNVDITIRNSVDTFRTYSGTTIFYQTVDSTLEALFETIPLCFTRHNQDVIINNR